MKKENKQKNNVERTVHVNPDTVNDEIKKQLSSLRVRGKVVRVSKQPTDNISNNNENSKMISSILKDKVIQFNENGIWCGICLFLLVRKDLRSPIYEELMNDMDFLDSVLGDDLDIILVGYENDEFSNESFISFYQEIEKEVDDWKWEDYPQIVIIKTYKIEKSNYLISNEIITMDIKKLIDVEYARSVVDLVKKIKDIIITEKERNKLEDCYSKIEKEIIKANIKCFVEKNEQHVQNIVTGLGKIISFISQTI